MKKKIGVHLAHGNKRSVKTRKSSLADRIITLVEEAKRKVVSAVNVALVYTYYEVGRMIVEEEQGGNKRAQYGKAQLQALSKKLTAQLGKGWSATNLEYMRKLFRVYSNSPIPQTGFEESAGSPQTVYPFRLSWSHYLVLMRIDNPDERRFYEVEAVENDWDLDELKRQFNSSLYERLALSRDKKGVLELSKRGQIVRKPEDVIKRAVKGMLPKGPLGRQMIGKLHVYAGPEHKHAAQKPEVLEIKA